MDREGIAGITFHKDLSSEPEGVYRNKTTMLEFSLKGHRFVLRHLREADSEKYLAFFNALNEESIRCRFGYLLSELTEAAAKRRTAGKTEGERALAIFDGPQERIVAVGRCYLDGGTADAEIALVVSEPMRRLGLGRFLLDQLIGIARDEKSESVSAFLATKNAPVVKLLRSAGFAPGSANLGDDLKLVLTISPQGPDRTDHASQPPV